ncbi:MAG: glycosyltransferase family 39 protein [Candidatus Magasanikbacteria bacterium]|nr:glycosyltransferase family 39 protein [Candidatus Magasanikbacteria bacterium]
MLNNNSKDYMLNNSKNHNGLLLTLILILALLLRLAAINHGFPVIRHPDEPAVIRTALGIRFDANPGHFDWPHLFIYLNYFLYMGFAYLRDLVASMGWKPSISSTLPLVWNDNLIFYWLSRVFAAILGALTIFPIYLSGKSLFNPKVGLLCALTFTLIPFHVRHSHYALIDVPMIFFFSWGLYFCTKILQSRETKNYILAGLFIGFAASTKYNGALLSLVVPLAYLFRTLLQRGEKIFNLKGIFNLVLSGIFAVLGFVAGTPFSVFDYKTFLRTDGPKGALWQFTNVGKVELPEHLSKFISVFPNKLADDFGYTFLFAFFLVLIYFTYRLISKKFQQDELKIWFLLIPTIGFLYYISGFIRNPSHYYMITYPFVALISGYFIYRILEGLKYFKKIVLLVFFLVPLYFSVQNIIDLTNKDVSVMESTQ